MLKSSRKTFDFYTVHFIKLAKSKKRMRMQKYRAPRAKNEPNSVRPPHAAVANVVIFCNMRALSGVMISKKKKCSTNAETRVEYVYTLHISGVKIRATLLLFLGGLDNYRRDLIWVNFFANEY